VSRFARASCRNPNDQAIDNARPNFLVWQREKGSIVGVSHIRPETSSRNEKSIKAKQKKVDKLMKRKNITFTIILFLLSCSAFTFTAQATVDLFASINGTTQNGGGSILEFTPSGVQSTFASALGRPRGVAFDSAGNLFVATTTLDLNSGNYSGAILKIDSNGTQTTFADVSGPSDSFFLEDLKIDDSDNVFLMINDETDPNEASVIYRFAPDGTQSTFGNVPGQSYGLAFDSGGNLYAADFGDQTVYMFTPGGTRTIFVGPSVFDPDEGPAGLAFDRFGNLFVSTEIVKPGRQRHNSYVCSRWHREHVRLRTGRASRADF
jgi:DNA-binding beta-propeller fold protein YncE